MWVKTRPLPSRLLLMWILIAGSWLSEHGHAETLEDRRGERLLEDLTENTSAVHQPQCRSGSTLGGAKVKKVQSVRARGDILRISLVLFEDVIYFKARCHILELLLANQLTG